MQGKSPFAATLCVLLGTFLALCSTGCLSELIGDKRISYSYAGRLLKGDRTTPLASTRVAVLESRADMPLDDRSGFMRLMKTFARPTDAQGSYAGEFSITRALGGTLHPPTWSQVFVYVEQPEGWYVYEVEVDASQQDRTQTGRRMVVPPVAVGQDKPIRVVTPQSATVGSKGM